MFKKKYKSLSFAENFLSGGFTIGPFEFNGENAMLWAVVVDTKWGYLSCRLPFMCLDRKSVV